VGAVEMKNFDRFWALYPKRNGKKVGKYPCELWFEAKKPDQETVDKMLGWLKIDNGNRTVMHKKFYANLPDPIRFLKNRMWEDDIEKVAGVGSSDICRTEGCNNKWTSNYLCPECLKTERGY
jgi:hypothetical protein